jgi:hypothetical protein
MGKNNPPRAYPSKDEVDKTKSETGGESVALGGSSLSEDCGTIECCLVLGLFANANNACRLTYR